ncbi:hypothetical protein GGR50DRAFT_179370 [Xylaria sp. CBS 124048]|nr:hypothetical protein GGR50DRAFT_179370 [Xylaria sp. CBS 124048]
MFRLLRPRRYLMALAARAHPKHTPQPEIIRIQRVRFHRKRKIIEYLLKFGIAYAAYRVVTRILARAVDDELSEMTEQEQRAVEALDAEPIFIPFPGFTQEVYPLPYRGSDPEWQAYMKINEHPDLLLSVQKSLAEVVRRVVVKNAIQQGDSEAQISRFWFDVQYPPSPPPQFVRRGLSIGGEDGIAWAERPVTSTAVFWTRRALWPSALTSALWTFTRALVSQNVQTVTKLFDSETQNLSLTDVRGILRRIRRQLNKSSETGSVSSPIQTQDRASSESTGSSLPSVDKRSTGSTTAPATLGSGSSVNNAMPAMSRAPEGSVLRALLDHTSGPRYQFKKNFRQRWRGPTPYPPRGSIRLTGLVEIITPRHVITVDCVAWWDPQTRTFDAKSMRLVYRGVELRSQGPLR